MKAITSCNEKDIPNLVNSIAEGQVGASEDLIDNLMKYLYRGVSEERSNGLLFKWHRQVVDRTGLGSIVRAMTDRKSV